MCFPGGSDGKESACNAGDIGSIPGSGRCPGVGNDNPLQYSLLGSPISKGAWRATIQRVTKESDTTDSLIPLPPTSEERNTLHVLIFFAGSWRDLLLRENSEKERMGNFLEANEPWRLSFPLSIDFATQDHTGRTSI